MEINPLREHPARQQDVHHELNSRLGGRFGSRVGHRQDHLETVYQFSNKKAPISGGLSAATKEGRMERCG